MPRFYFHVRDGDNVRDTEGLVLADVAAARHEAVRNIRGMLSDDIIHGRLPLRQWIDVADERGWRVMSVPFGDAVDIEE